MVVMWEITSVLRRESVIVSGRRRRFIRMESVLWQTPSSAVPVSRSTAVASMPSIPEMRTPNIPNNMSHRRSRTFPLIHHRRPWTERRPLTVPPNNRRPAIFLPIERIPEIRHSIRSRIDTLLLIRISLPIQNPPHTSLMRLDIPLPLLRLRLPSQPLRDTLVPRDHFLVRLHREAVTW